MSYKQTNNTAEEIETLSADDEKLRRMLGNLKKVSAPANFDFQLKARIARGEPTTSARPSLFPSLRYVLPLGIIVLLAGFILFNFSFIAGNQANQVVENKPAIRNEAFRNEIESVSNKVVSTPIIPDETIAATPANNQSEIKILNAAVARANNKNSTNKPSYISARSSTKNSSDKNEGALQNRTEGSLDQAQKEVEVITQKNSNKSVDSLKQPDGVQNKISLNGVLSEIGIEADYSEKNWKILSVKENSLAKRAGLQSGDIIEAIDDKKPSSDDVFLQNFSGKIFKILRAGKPMIIDLTAKQ